MTRSWSSTACHHRGSAVVAPKRGAENTTEVTLPTSDSTTFCKIGIPSQMVLKWMFAIELAQECKTSILTIALGYANLYK